MEIRIKTADEFRDAHVVIEIRAADQAEAELVAERLYDPNAAVEVMTGNYQRARHRIAELEEKVRLCDEVRKIQQTERIYTAAEVGAAQASEAELVAAPLRRQIEELTAELDRYRKAHVCTSRCSMNSHVAFEGNRIVKDLEEILAQVRSELRETHRARMAAEDRARHAEAEASQARRQLIDLGEVLIVERERADRATEWAERAEGRLAAFSLEQKAKLADAERAVQILSAQLGRVSGAVHGQELVQAALRTDWTSWSEREAAALTSALRAVRDALGSPLIGPPSPPKAVTSQA